jgi:hypothetical protein
MKHLMILLTAILCFSCNQKEEKPVLPPAEQPAKQAALNNKPCDADFDTFFKKFQTDSIFQREHIKFPLKNTYLNSGGDYEVVRKDITILTHKFLDFATDKEAAAMENGAFTIAIEKQKDSVFYQTRGIDNGIHADIKFAFKYGCWYLVAIEDSST